ncbi:MAG: hypothetical protein Q8L48_27235 [Archangium sp.]|nr:hypothetical protein [Archangium sp.]
MHRYHAVVCCLVVGLSSCRCNPPLGGRAALSPDEAGKACAVLQACFPAEWRGGLFGSDLSSCSTGTGTWLPTSPGALMGKGALSTGLEGPLLDIYRCVLGAGGDCTKAGACWARTGQPGSCSPASSLQQGTCSDAEVLSGCTADGLAFSVDCRSYGGGCHSDSVFFARVSLCDLGACPAKTQCRGAEAELCVGEGLFLGDCSTAGQSCMFDEDGGARCDTTQTCDAGTRTCEGTVAVDCVQGQPIRADCARNASLKRCEAGRCVETGNECTVSADRASCDGATVRYCQDGFRRELDCAALGFASCRAGACSSCEADAGSSCGCTRTSCAFAGRNCGSISDGCGGMLDCGTCPSPQICGGRGQANICAQPCTPTTCAAQGKTCGTISNGCGGTLACGACTLPATCGGGGTPNTCGTGCTPTTCSALGKDCGTVANGCGGTLSCGTCAGPQTCGGGGTANVCGSCTAATCAGQGWDCGTGPNGCGGLLSCGSTCTGNRFCGGGGQNLCGRNACTPTTCAAQGKDCGVISDGCSTALDCGSCTSPQTCVANVCQ